MYGGLRGVAEWRGVAGWAKVVVSGRDGIKTPTVGGVACLEICVAHLASESICDTCVAILIPIIRMCVSYPVYPRLPKEGQI